MVALDGMTVTSSRSPQYTPPLEEGASHAGKGGLRLMYIACCLLPGALIETPDPHCEF